eukprot:SAG22_NODE_6626_length_830_cov_1.001368_1_plen_171_part_00
MLLLQDKACKFFDADFAIELFCSYTPPPGSAAAAAATAAAPGGPAEYCCVEPASVTTGLEVQYLPGGSSKAVPGSVVRQVKKGERGAALEHAVSAGGVRRVRTVDGWVSVAAKDGTTLLQPAEVGGGGGGGGAAGAAAGSSRGAKKRGGRPMLGCVACFGRKNGGEDEGA